MHKIRSYTLSFLADSGVYFVQDENNFINPLLQVGSGSLSNEKSTGSGGPKINGSDRILIPEKMRNSLEFYASLFGPSSGSLGRFGEIGRGIPLLKRYPTTFLKRACK